MARAPISLFVSDVHLNESRNDIVTAFCHFIEEIAPTADRLYILGDLFDYWAGDDIETPLTKKIAERLQTLSQKGTEIFFIPGNRDFSLGHHYAKSAGMTLVGEAFILDDEILLIHGDELCIDDISYQRYKKWIRNPLILSLLKKLPKSYRLKLVHKIKDKSQQSTTRKIADVNEAYVDRFFKVKKVQTIIHGHTHRPFTHIHNQHNKRYVLSDWDQKGDYLKLENGDISRHILNIDPFQVES